MSFPEIKHELFVNFLGYKGSNMIYLNRCKGVCLDNSECKPAKVKIFSWCMINGNISGRNIHILFPNEY